MECAAGAEESGVPARYVGMSRAARTGHGRSPTSFACLALDIAFSGRGAPGPGEATVRVAAAAGWAGGRGRGAHERTIGRVRVRVRGGRWWCGGTRDEGPCLTTLARGRDAHIMLNMTIGK